MKTFEEAICTDATVHKILKRLGSSASSYEDIIAALATEKVQLMDALIKSEAINPRKFVFPDGRVVVWRCPEHMIPTTKIE